MKKITNTQYLKKGDKTNVGKVDLIHDNANFKTDDGFSHNLNEENVYKVNSLFKSKDWENGNDLEKEYPDYLITQQNRN